MTICLGARVDAACVSVVSTPAWKVTNPSDHLVTLGTFGWRIAFRGAEKAAAGFARILTGWDVSVEEGHGSAADVLITRSGRGFSWHSARMSEPLRWTERTPRTAIQVIGDVHDVLFDWFLAARPQHLSLHAAAARFGDACVCFPSVARAGKSTLMIELARRGHQVLCDDVLPLGPQQNRALGLGIAPRLRLPLPPEASAAFRRFLAEREGPQSHRLMYACLHPGEIAPLGTELPIAGLVLLARDSRHHRAGLGPISRAEVLRELILQDFADAVPAPEKLDRLIGVLEGARCFRLRYATMSSAVDVLRRAFGPARSSDTNASLSRASP